MINSFLRFMVLLCLSIVSCIITKAQTFVIANWSNEGLVLAVPCGNYINGQQLIIWNFSNSLGDQKFNLYRLPNGAIAIGPCDNPRMRLGIANAIIEQNRPVILWESNNNLDQQWELEHISGSLYIIRSRQNRNYVLTPLKGELDARIVIQEYTGATYQQWGVMATDGDIFRLYKGIYSK